MKIYRKHRISLLTGAVAMLMGATGCSDDLDTGFGVNEVEGRDTKISLSVSAPEMPRLESRTDMADDDAYKVVTLWVGIYNSGSGKSTLLDDNSTTNNGLFLVNGEHGFQTSQDNHVRHPLTDIATKSGRSYIVAVANPDMNTGYKMDAQGNIGDEKPLLTLLQEASTWEEFKSIVISRPLRENGAADIFMPNATINPLVMSGIYSEEGQNHAANYDWSQVEPVYIGVNSAGVTLHGAIHLRRPYSQIKFDIQRAENTEIVDFEVESYVVHNVPTYGWLFERKQAENPAGKPWEYANAGDPMELDVTKNTNYRNSLTYTSADIEGKDNHFTFDFWQMENKRTGILEGTDATDYQKRDVEWDDGNRNTGVYSSLCPKATPQVATLNNFAGYVEINAKLTYTNPAGNPNNPTIPDQTFPTINSREVYAKYIVHLGYIGGNANDFNSLRNSIYTYRVKIKSATEIIVEAFKQGENQPGAEGTVIDVTNQMFNLDAHYAAFNIELTAENLRDFSFSIVAGDHRFSVDKAGNDTGSTKIPTSTTDADYQYYSWIEMMPTNSTDANVLAAYPGIGSPKLYKLNDIRKNYKEDGTGLTAGYYTVFVNEYTYEGETTGAVGNQTGGKWRDYVNQPNRMAYLNVAQATSADGLSRYFRSKYAVSQRSIQTYYNTADNPANAIGVEHINETFGMDMRWPTTGVALADGTDDYPDVPNTTIADGGVLSPDNGRYNVWIASGGGNIITDASQSWTTAGAWTTYVQCGNANNSTTGVANAVKRIDNNNQRVPNNEKLPKTWPVPMPVLLSAGDFSGATQSATASINTYDPQTDADEAQVIHAMHACMNRNRDLNGNGVIDANELRWYLPASGKYARVIMGRNALSTPIMDYDNNTELTYAPSSGNNGRLSLATSDGKTVWAVEGMSMSNFGQYHVPSWSVRCIRNLGVNLSEVTSDPTDDPIDPAYSVQKGTGDYSTGAVVKNKHYYGTSLRDYSEDPLPLHKTNSPYNKIGRYGFEVALRGNAVTNGALVQQSTEATASYTSANGTTADGNPSPTSYTSYINNATSCADLNNYSGRRGWRAPNQKELIIMRREGLLLFPNDYSYYQGCTIEFYQNSSPFDSNNSDITNNKTTQNPNGYQGHRICTVRFDAATANWWNTCTNVRCVRDLTAAEAGMTYNQIRQYKQP